MFEDRQHRDAISLQKPRNGAKVMSIQIATGIHIHALFEKLALMDTTFFSLSQQSEDSYSKERNEILENVYTFSCNYL